MERNTGKGVLYAGPQDREGLYKIFSAQTLKGNYYVQRMPGPCSLGVRYRLMKDRRALQSHDYTDHTSAIEAMLNILENVLVEQERRNLFVQNELKYLDL